MKKKPDLIVELKKQRNFIDNQNKQIIKKILEVCIVSIKNINLTGTTEYVYEVPAFIIGFPLYDISGVTGLVSLELKRKGFKTTFIHPNKIHILW